MNDSQQHRSAGSDDAQPTPSDNQAHNIFIVEEQYSVANGTSSKEQSSGLDQLESFQIRAQQNNQEHNQHSSSPSAHQNRELSSGKEPSPQQVRKSGNQLGFLGLNDHYVYGGGEGERIVTFSHKIEKKNPQQENSEMFNAAQMFGAGQNTQGFPNGKDGSSMQDPKLILDDGEDEEQQDEEDSSHFGYLSGSVEDEKNNLDDSLLTMHMNERVNSIPNEDAMIAIHQGLHFSKNSGNTNNSKQAGQTPTTMIMYETARTSCIEEGQIDPIVQDGNRRVFKNLLGLESTLKEKTRKDVGQTAPQSIEPDFTQPSGGKQFLNVRFGTIGLGNNSIQGGTECEARSNHYCFDTANRNKPSSNLINMNALYSDFQIKSGNAKASELQDASSAQPRQNLIPSPHPQHKNIYENSNYNQKQSHSKLIKPPGQLGVGNIESLRSPQAAFNQSSSFAFINNNIQMEQTLDKVSYHELDRGPLEPNEERKNDNMAIIAGGYYEGPIDSQNVSNKKPNVNEHRVIKHQNVSVKDVDMVIDGSQLYESESELKKIKRTPYPNGLQAEQKDIIMESVEYPLTVSMSQNKSGFISQNLMTSKLTSNNTLVQQALAQTNNGLALSALREQSHIQDSSSNHMLLAPTKKLPSLKQPFQCLPTLSTPKNGTTAGMHMANEQTVKNGASLPPQIAGTLASNAFSHLQSDRKIESDMAKRDFPLSSLDTQKNAVIMGGSGVGNTTGAAARKKSAFKQNSKLNKTLNRDLTKLNIKDSSPNFNKTVNPTRGKVTLNIESGFSGQDDQTSRNNEDEEDGYENNNDQNTSRPTNINNMMPADSHNQISDFDDRVEQNTQSGDESARNKPKKRKVLFNNDDSRGEEPRPDQQSMTGVGGRINQYPAPFTENQFPNHEGPENRSAFDISNPSFNNIPRKFVSKRTEVSLNQPGGQINWKDSASFSFVASNNLGGKNVSRAVTKHTDFTPKNMLEDIRKERRRSNFTNVVRGTTLHRIARGATKTDGSKHQEKDEGEMKSHKESKYHHSDNTAKIDKQIDNLQQNFLDNLAREKLKTMDPKSLFLFTQTSVFRITAYKVIKSKYFTNFILICLFINCIALAMYEFEEKYRLRYDITEGRFNVDIINIAFTGVFIVEMALHSIYKGFIVYQNSYLRNPSILIDVIVIVSGFIEFFVPADSSSALRVVRIVFRPLKMINIFPNVKSLLVSLVKSLPDFVHVGVFMIFVFILFATMGVQQYSGMIYNTCRLTPYPDEQKLAWDIDASIKRACTLSGAGNFECPSGLYCGNIQSYDYLLLENEHIERSEYLNYGITNFDHIGSSLLTVFQMITSETWSYQIFNLMDIDIPFLGAVYCILIIIVGQFFLLNLILAVIVQAFMNAHNEQVELEVKDMEEEEEALQQHTNMFTEGEGYSDMEESKYDSRGSMEDELIHGQTLKGVPTMKNFDKMDPNNKRRFSENSDIVEEEELSENDSYGDNDDPDIGNSEIDDHIANDQPKAASARVPMIKGIKLSKPGESNPKNGGGPKEMTGFFKDTPVVPNYPSINNRSPKKKPVTSATKLRADITPTKDPDDTPNKNELLQQTPDFAKPPPPPPTLQNMGDFFYLNVRIKADEETKYNNNEGFIDFLHNQATMRRIVEVITGLKNLRLERERREEAARIARQKQTQLEYEEFEEQRAKFGHYYGPQNLPVYSTDLQFNMTAPTRPPVAPLTKNITQTSDKPIQKYSTKHEPRQPQIMCMDMDSESVNQKIAQKYSSKKTEIEPRVIKGPQYGSGHGPRHQEGSVGSSTNHQNFLLPSNFKHQSTHTPLAFNRPISSQRGQMISADNNFRSDDQKLMMFNDAASGFKGSQHGHLGIPFKKQCSIKSGVSAMSGRSAMSKRINNALPERLKHNEILLRMQEKLLDNIEAVERGETPVAASEDKPKKKKKKSVQESEDENAPIAQKGIADMLSKKFLLEVKKNMTQKLIRVAEHKNQIMMRRQESPFIDALYKFQHNPFFQLFMQLVVIGNLLVLASDHYPLDKENMHTQEAMNIFFTLIFMLEIVIKLKAYGLRNYFNETNFHFFDVFIGILSFLDVIISQLFLQDTYELFNSGLITCLRFFRVLRLFKLARYWRSFKILLDTLWMTITNIYSFTCLLVLVIFVYALIGIEFFANQARINRTDDSVDYRNGQTPKFNFDSFLDSIVTMFVIFTNDEQTKIFYDYYRAVDPLVSLIFWISFVVIAQKILQNIFISIILENFHELNLKNQIYRIEEESFEQSFDLKGDIKRKSKEIWQYLMKKYDEKFGEYNENAHEEEGDEGNKSERKRLTDQNPTEEEAITKKGTIKSEKSEGEKKEKDDHDEHGDHEESEYGPDLAMGFIHKSNPVRRFFDWLLHHRMYENFIVFLILLTSLQLALESPNIDPTKPLKKVLSTLNSITIGIFTAEFIAKLIVYGVYFNGHHSYLRNVWNINDFVILVFSYLYLTSLVYSLKIFKALKFLKALRLISRNAALQIALKALIFATPDVVNFTVIMGLFYMIFSVVLISTFKGRLWHCEDIDITIITEEILNKWQCLSNGGNWMQNNYNFDNFGNSLISLFVMSTNIGWSDILSQTLTSGDIDFINARDSEEFKVSNHPGWIAFFILFMIVGSFFFLNLFVGVVIHTFQIGKEIVGGEKLLTEKQKMWIEMRLLVLKSAPKYKLIESKNPIRSISFKIIHHDYFSLFIKCSIIVNTMVLAFKWYRQSSQIDQIGEVTNQVFTAIFFIEFCIRIIAIGPHLFFLDGWNIFEFIIAWGSVVEVMLTLTVREKLDVTTVLKSFRILRLIRLLRRGGKHLQLIFNTLVITMQTLSNIGGLLILFIYIYCIAGMMYFGEVKRTGNMNDYINFESFSGAFITLFTISTGDSWSTTMASFTHGKGPNYECLEDPGYADYVANGRVNLGCGSQWSAIAYFISFMFVIRLIFLKLFIALIIDGFKNMQSQDTRLFNNHVREHFRTVWAEFDPKATTFIKLADLRNFLLMLGAPLGFDSTFTESRFLQDKFMASLELPTYQNFRCYQFLDVLDALSFRMMIIDHLNKLEAEVKKQHMEKLQANGGKPSDTNNEPPVTWLNKKGIRECEKEVYKLIYQKKSDQIVSFKELWEKEQSKQKNRESIRDPLGVTSSHHMAVEAIVRRVRAKLQEKREAAAVSQERDRPFSNIMVDQLNIDQTQVKPSSENSAGE